MGKKGGGDEANAEAAQARADEQARQDKIRAGTGRIDDIFKTNFTDDFYKGQSKAFSDYATPQLETQLADARKQLTFALDRSHLLDSSVRADKTADLEREAGTQRQAIADQALGYENQSKSNVEASKADLINTLNSTGDAEGAANNALSRAQTLSAPTPFSPLSGLFSTFTGALGTQAAAERAQYYSGGAVKAPFNTGLFAPSGSVKVS